MRVENLDKVEADGISAENWLRTNGLVPDGGGRWIWGIPIVTDDRLEPGEYVFVAPRPTVECGRCGEEVHPLMVVAVAPQTWWCGQCASTTPWPRLFEPGPPAADPR